MKIVYLELRSFWCGRHVHADLRSSDGGYQIIHNKLTAKEALRRNKEEGPKGYRWKPGDLSAGFESEERARAAAKATWREHFPDADVLVVGDRSYIEPHEPLDGDKGIVTAMQKLWSKYKPLAEKDHVEATHGALCRAWQELTR